MERRRTLDVDITVKLPSSFANTEHATMFRTGLAIAGLVGLFIPATALAHAGHGLDMQGAAAGFGSGLIHPLTGLDHWLTMIGMGLWAAQQQSRHSGLCLIGAFLSSLMLGFVIGLTLLPAAWIELGLIVSLLSVGLLVGLARPLPMLPAMLTACGLALFHGMAHGAELSPGPEPALFALGLLMTATLLCLGSMRTARAFIHRWHRPVLVRTGGAAILLAGLTWLVMA